MINIRYHIVSITAVFLALGIGVALGSTFLDGATVDVLNRNITDAEDRIGAARDRIEELEGQVSDAEARDDALILLGTDRLLGDTLSDQPILVIAEPDVDGGELDALRSVLERSGADLRGTLELSDRLAFDGDEVDEELAAALELEDPTPDELRAAVQAALVDALTAAGQPGDPAVSEEDPEETTTTETTTTVGPTTTGDPEAPTTTTTTEAPDPAPGDGGSSPDDETADPTALDGEQPELITTLLERGYLELRPGPGRSDDDPILEQQGYRYVHVGGAAPDPIDTEVLLGLLPAGEGTVPLPTVVVAGTPPIPDADEELAPTVVARVRDDEARSRQYTTVDDLETFAGLAATVLSLADLGQVAPGHYGQAEGASAVLPPVP